MADIVADKSRVITPAVKAAMANGAKGADAAFTKALISPVYSVPMDLSARTAPSVRTGLSALTVRSLPVVRSAMVVAAGSAAAVVAGGNGVASASMARNCASSCSS